MTAAPDDRRRELAQIHIAKKDLGLDDETYRAMLWSLGRVRSAADLGAEGRNQVLAHLRSRGFKPRKKGAEGMEKGVEKPSFDWTWVNAAAAERRPMLRKLAMIIKEAGRPKAYIDGTAMEMFAIERIEFCAPEQLHAIVAALVKDQQRRRARAEKQRA